MRKEVVIISGANGEIGYGLIEQISEMQVSRIVALDLKPLEECLIPLCEWFIQGDILDTTLLARLTAEYEITTIYHLASILSTKAEYSPEMAHQINVDGTINLLRLAVELSQWQGKSIKFIYPSSIAVYGLPSLEIKNKSGKIKEDQFCSPITIYGINKLYCEHLGLYYAQHYRQLAKDRLRNNVDFRAIRFPGLISAETIPTGGTSDYGPEMLHYAAQGLSYSCFVRPDTQIPFMAMPDAVNSLLLLEQTPLNHLQQLVYNVTSFSPTAQEIFEVVKQSYPSADITFEVNQNRQTIVDSWPSDVNDAPARENWGWQPRFNFQKSFNEYLLPSVKLRYASKGC